MDPQPPISPYPRPNMQEPFGGGPSCPQCNSANTKEVKYTWWGGIVGPKMMNLQHCNACGFQFNRATRKSTRNAVIAYNLVALVLALVIFAAVRLSLG